MMIDMKGMADNHHGLLGKMKYWFYYIDHSHPDR